MSEPLHRTPEWDRLKRSGFFQIRDEPGRITVFRVSPAKEKMEQMKSIAIVAPLAGTALGFVAGFGGMIFGLILGLVLGAACFFGTYMPAKKRIDRFADRVIFAASDVYFYTGKEEQGSLPREALQQIVPDQDEFKLRSHKFLSDVGYIWAFPMSTETEHLLMNNILMAAFKQPVHLDLMKHEAPAARVVEMSAAPQISGL